MAKAPEDITAGEILRVLEGSLSPVECIENQACPMFSQCACLTIWSDIKQAIDQVVDRYTLADLVKEYQEKNEVNEKLCSIMLQSFLLKLQKNPNTFITSVILRSICLFCLL